MRTIIPGLALALCFLLPAPARSAEAIPDSMLPLDPKAPLSFGVSQPNGPKRAASGKALLEPYLSDALKRPVKVVILGSYEELSQALASGKVDLAWVEPVAFVVAQQKNRDVQAIAKALRRGKLYYRAALIVRADSPVQALADLKGKSVAWVSKSSASGYLFPRALVASQGTNPDSFFRSQSFAGDHPRVCELVREKRADAGATFTDERAADAAPVADGCAESPPVGDFRVIAVSAPIPNDVVAARPGFDERVADSTLQAFAQMSQSEAGRQVLRDVFHVDGWGIAVAGDFGPVAEALQAAGVRPTAPHKASAKKPARTSP
jgi:phosphate/phosphite/phosphonate ABC transporter binding protein